MYMFFISASSDEIIRYVVHTCVCMYVFQLHSIYDFKNLASNDIYDGVYALYNKNSLLENMKRIQH